jgi:TonB family protein
MKFNKDDITALIISILIHILVFLYLYFGVLRTIIPVRDDGIFVNFGDDIEASGEFEPQQSISAQELTPEIPPPPQHEAANEEMITQDEEETIHIPNTEKKKEKIAETKPKPKPTPKKPTEEERKEDERKKREAEQKQKEGNINNQVSNAFSRNNTQGTRESNTENNGSSDVSGFSDNSVNSSQSQGEAASGKGNQGSPFGNSNSGPNQGVGGFGSFSLSGRTLREGALQRPAYSAQVEGRIVINITVDNYGNVIFAEIGKGTNIDDATMRKSALDSARKAKFNKIQSTNNQTGTITYNYQFNN